MSETQFEPSVSDSDRARIEWCIATVREIADLGRAVLGDKYPQAVQVVGTLKRVLEPNIVEPKPALPPRKRATPVRLKMTQFPESENK